MEAEVQTEAFIQTGKDNADSLNRQEKALATLALIQQKAAVQIGDLDRTQASFANQSRLVNAELRELRESKPTPEELRFMQMTSDDDNDRINSIL